MSITPDKKALPHFFQKNLIFLKKGIDKCGIMYYNI